MCVRSQVIIPSGKMTCSDRSIFACSLTITISPIPAALSLPKNLHKKISLRELHNLLSTSYLLSYTLLYLSVLPRPLPTNLGYPTPSKLSRTPCMLSFITNTASSPPQSPSPGLSSSFPSTSPTALWVENRDIPLRWLPGPFPYQVLAQRSFGMAISTFCTRSWSSQNRRRNHGKVKCRVWYSCLK